MSYILTRIYDFFCTEHFTIWIQSSKEFRIDEIAYVNHIYHQINYLEHFIIKNVFILLIYITIYYGDRKVAKSGQQLLKVGPDERGGSILG